MVSCISTQACNSIRVEVIVTAGGIEEDIIKCLAYRGDFSLSCADLRSKGLNRVGSLLVPNENYCYEAPKLRYVVFCVNFEDKLLTKLQQMDSMWRCLTSSMKSLCAWDVKGCEDVRKVVVDLKSKGASPVGVAGFCWGGAVDSYKGDDEHAVKCAMEAHTDLLNWFTKYLK
ncbi:hypothetical protein L1987_17267 [Smallanthus sonchifolius]|uniref:Uncharacterized protein n=1 Tax=Smallanthus sonchifolius TaxID=185202 RepID=A0ACB9IXH2_9ASTR|nr:hypothetical protein L1987_17267 [Smallanthus sonchifolius]